MKQNILITSVGKRVVLTEIFKETRLLRHLNNKIFTTDISPALSPAAYVSDFCFAVPRCTDDNYIPILLKLCIDNDIKVVIPTIDTELAVLARNYSLFLEHGIQLVVSDIEFIEICRDKRKTHKLFKQLNIDIPSEIDKHKPKFPLFAKPYDGSLSCNTHHIEHPAQLTQELLEDPKLIFMDYINPSEFSEFTVDLYYGQDHHLKCIVPRERLTIRAGEINKGITRKNIIVDYLKERISHIPGVRGVICLQLFMHQTSGQIYGIEINPRFGGGYPLSYHAKANYPLHIIDEYILGNEISYYDSWEGNTLMLRYDKEIIVPNCDSV